MKSLGYRLTVAACLPWLLSGCPSDPIVPETSAGSTGDATSSTGTPTPDPDTGPVEESTSGPSEGSTGTTAATASSSGPGPDTGESGPPPAVCGNNEIEGDEVCDLAQVNGETCESLGFQGGQLGCLLTCDDYNLLGCFICGNEVVDIAEDCEVVVPEEVTCVSLGFEAGDVTCGADCLYDLSECSICGDGIQQGPEQCDGIDFGGEDCMSIGFDSGNLGCNLAECAFVYTGCAGGQYIQNFEAGLMMPIEFSVDVAQPWTVDDALPINGSYSARSGAFPIGVGGLTNLTLDASFPVAGNITFDHEESTPAGFDFLEFYVDGIQQQTWSGINAPATHMQAVPAGMHTFQWRFNRSGFSEAGSNAVWVDDIILDGGVPI